MKLVERTDKQTNLTKRFVVGRKYLVHKIYGDKIIRLIPGIRLKDETHSLFAVSLSKKQVLLLTNHGIDIK